MDALWPFVFGFGAGVGALLLGLVAISAHRPAGQPKPQDKPAGRVESIVRASIDAGRMDREIHQAIERYFDGGRQS